MKTPIRILLAEVGLDGHDRGVKVVARALEVLLQETPPRAIVKTLKRLVAERGPR